MPGPIVVRNSELTTWRRCRQRWFWAYRMEFKPVEVAIPLRFGDLVHQALAAWYVPTRDPAVHKIRRGPHPAETFEELYIAQISEYGEYGMFDEDEEWTDAKELGVHMLTNYVDQYGRDDRYMVIAAEHPFQVDIVDEDGLVLCTLVGTFDAIVMDLETGKLWLLEHKTVKTVKLNHLPLDEQAGTYFAVAPLVFEQLGLGAYEQPRLEGILYNFLRKGKKDDRPTNEYGQSLNQDGTVSKRQPSPLFARTEVRRNDISSQAVLNRIANQALEMQQVDEGIVPVYKNPTQDCSWQCEFFDMCVLHEDGGDWTDYAAHAMKFWDPYEMHNGYLIPQAKEYS